MPDRTPKSRSFGIHVLWAIFRQSQLHGEVTIREIVLDLIGQHRKTEAVRPDDFTLAELFRVLSDLEQLHLIHRKPIGDGQTGFSFWRLNSGSDLPPFEDDDGDNGDDREPPAPPEGGNSGGGGGGFREVLSHPMLFAYDEAGFDEALRRAIGPDDPDPDPDGALSPRLEDDMPARPQAFTGEGPSSGAP